MTEGGRTQDSTASGGERCTGGGRMRVSTASSGERCTGGGRTQDSTASSGKRCTGDIFATKNQLRLPSPLLSPCTKTTRTEQNNLGN